jgi:hypothetical protein
MRRIRRFTFEGVTQAVKLTGTEDLPPDVSVDLYTFVGDDTKDLAIFTTRMRTPLQRVLKGTRTVEGHISGEAKLTITKPDESQKVYEFGKASNQPPVNVEVGDLMRWEVLNNSTLVAWEVCFPPYKDGRYQDVEY